ncbi:MAG TPA: hypothetical protein VNH41_04305, partial [Steroidobacteraceae bacterium]|nr:hypothetical protein [Steroidobacteraceae bacterium]
MTEEQLSASLSADLQDAASYCDTELGPLRAAAIHYYHARPFGDEEQGRSTFVQPVVRDTIRATLPSLMKKFFGSQRVVQFAPGSTKGGQFADDATATVNYVFSVQNNGFMVLWSGFKDGLRSKMGWLKWWWDNSVEVTERKFTGVSEDQLLEFHSMLLPGEELHIDGKEVVGFNQVVVPPPQMAPQGAPDAQNQPPPPPQGENEAGEDPAEEASESPEQEQAEQAGSQPENDGSQPGSALQGAPVAPPQIQQVPIFAYSIRVTTRKKKNRVYVAAVPADEIIFARDGWDFDNLRLIAHRTRKTRGELVAMGVSREDLEQIPADVADQMTNIEFQARQPTASVMPSDGTGVTWDQAKVPYYESYYRVDFDGDGISELRKVCSIGISGKIVSNDIVDEVPLALLCPDPEPHVMVGLSQADYTMDLQLVGSHVWRDVFDSLKQSIFPRMAFVEGQVNVDDVLNTEIGAGIRMRAPGMVQPLEVPFSGQQALPVLEQLDQAREQRTGIGRAAMALDGSALQSTTPVAAQATVSASEAQVDLTARMFAEGVKKMFRGVLRLLVRHQDQQMQFELNGHTFQVNPKEWDPDMHAIVDTGLGVGGNTDAKMAALTATAAQQKEVLMTIGAENPLCGLQEYYNSLTAILETAGLRDSHRYWRDPTVSKEKGITLQPSKPSPEQVIA